MKTSIAVLLVSAAILNQQALTQSPQTAEEYRLEKAAQFKAKITAERQAAANELAEKQRVEKFEALAVYYANKRVERWRANSQWQADMDRHQYFAVIKMADDRHPGDGTEFQRALRDVKKDLLAGKVLSETGWPVKIKKRNLNFSI